MELRQALPKIVTETVPGPKSKALIDRRAAATATAVKCVYPVAIERGEGAMVEDLDGNIFLDWGRRCRRIECRLQPAGDH